MALSKTMVTMMAWPRPRCALVDAVTYRGLALHRPLIMKYDGSCRKLMRGWQITHMRSGKSVFGRALDTTLDKAAFAFRWIANAYDWERAEEELDKKTAKSVANAVIEHLQIGLFDETQED